MQRASGAMLARNLAISSRTNSIDIRLGGLSVRGAFYSNTILEAHTPNSRHTNLASEPRGIKTLSGYRCLIQICFAPDDKIGDIHLPFLAPNGEFFEPDHADATCPVPSQKIFCF